VRVRNALSLPRRSNGGRVGGTLSEGRGDMVASWSDGVTMVCLGTGGCSLATTKSGCGQRRLGPDRGGVVWLVAEGRRQRFLVQARAVAVATGGAS
jgi:hypothetical protein